MIKKRYDVVIIGAGIGGLVCGCYLSKSGLRVLLIERNNELGGYCKSFTRNGFTFNTCIRGFVGAKKGGIFNKIATDLNIVDELKLLRPPVYDYIQFSNKAVALHNDFKKTIEEIVQLFPKEEVAIRSFFSLLTNPDLTNEFYKYRQYTFKALIDEFFRDKELKLFLSILRIDSGDPPYKTAAIADLMLMRGNIIDGGYFPEGGMQNLPNIFEKRFLSYGGEVLKNTFVTKIETRNGVARGVKLEDGSILDARFVVSNSDATFTYNSLLGKSCIPIKTLDIINRMIPSTSLFLMYLATSKPLGSYLPYQCSAVWNFSKSIGDGIVCTLPSLVDKNLAPKDYGNTTMYFGMPFQNEIYWEKNRNRIAELFIQRFLRVFPLHRSDICFQETVTPFDLYKSTLNRSGGSRGWAPTVKQINSIFPTVETPVPNVFLVGHWVVSYSGNGGITFAAQTAKKVALQIIRCEHK